MEVEVSESMLRAALWRAREAGIFPTLGTAQELQIYREIMLDILQYALAEAGQPDHAADNAADNADNRVDTGRGAEAESNSPASDRTLATDPFYYLLC